MSYCKIIFLPDKADRVVESMGVEESGVGVERPELG